MKKWMSMAAAFCLLLALSACFGGEPAPSSSSEAASSSAPQSSSVAVSSSRPPDDGPSYDMDGWGWKEHTFEGFLVSLPSSCSIQGDKIYVNEAQIPDSIFAPNFYPAGVGWLRKDLTLDGNSLAKVSDASYRFTPLEGSPRDIVLSDDATLPEDTFYEFGDYLAFTYSGGVGGDGSRESMIKSTVYIPKSGGGMGITFYGEVGAEESKAFYERVVESIRPDPNPPKEPDASKAPVTVVQPSWHLDIVKTANVTVELNLRAGPGTSYESLGLIPAGTPVSGSGMPEFAVPGTEIPWLFVTYNGMQGWVSAEYLAFTN